MIGLLFPLHFFVVLLALAALLVHTGRRDALRLPQTVPAVAAAVAVPVCDDLVLDFVVAHCNHEKGLRKQDGCLPSVGDVVRTRRSIV
ncbi:hypothetical protein Micbo1qcDRAFT_164123 [Microdochium bolleyi]|uniref:Secreted protein n=1 Tax=Microdochium bolleyi TaxID=196109 RepID=A0A136J009_9PEZI|nr:hypothetical protein Micbo1qcDRAFT_164123 [Microdochium bolleyi]